MQNLVRKIIELSARHRFIVLALYAILIAVGTWATLNTPLDAIPDVSDNQVIVYVDWPGRSPQLVEDQVTYPLASNLQGLPNLKTVRAQSMFGFSLVYVIFDDDVDIYWARTRVLERLNYISGLLPAGAVPRLGPEGTGVGHVFWYTLRSKQHDLAQLRAIQDWYLKLGLQATPGVAEVASVGGFVKQYQISLDPVKMAARGVSLDTVVNAVRRSNNDVGGRLLEVGQTEYIVRGIGYVRSIADLSNIVVDAPNGVPIYLSALGTVSTGPEMRRGLLDENGTGEVVGGIIVARYGENAKEVIDSVKTRLAELKKGLPAGVTIHTAYDRSELIERAVGTLKEALTEEAIIVSLVAIVFLLHIGSAATVLVGLPLSVLFSFVLMKYFGITSNIMSLGGVALAIGEIVDASIVMVENAHRHLSEGTEKVRQNRVETIIRASKQVGPAIFGSLLVMIVSFLPVFMLTGQEGKLFRPLAYTKTFAMLGASILAITLVPVLMTFFLRGRLRTESENPVNRFFTRLYEPFLKWSLRNRKVMLGLNVAALVIAIPMMMSLGKEFMPPLDEGSLLYMPIMMPSINITEAKRLVQIQDGIIAQHPAVKYVLGKVGRAETATDPAPVSMFETVIELKPKDEWPEGMTKDDIIEDLQQKLQIPGVTNAWTQPIINRIDMLNTGVRTQLGVKIFGSDLKTLEQLGLQTEAILRKVPGAADLYTERISGGQYLNIEPDRAAIARYGIPVGVVLDAIETAVGGMNVTTTVEGRARFPVQVRYLADYRDNLAALQTLLITIPRGGGAMPVPSASPGGGGGMGMGGGAIPQAAAQAPASIGGGGTSIQLPLGQLARITTSPGPAMINSENGQLRALVQLNARGRDMGSFVDEAKAALDRDLTLPAGYSLQWSGQYENQIHASRRLRVLIPFVLLIIFAILYFTLHSAMEAGLVMLSVPFALIGGVYLMWLYGFNWSVAVWVGFIALYGVAVQTGVVMVLYLHEALDRKMLDGKVTVQEVFDATVEGALLRVRPKIMTVATTVLGLVPLLWATGAGSDVMKPIAVPLIGGMVTSTIHVLLVTPIIFFIVKRHELKRGRLKLSGLRATEELQETDGEVAPPADLFVVENVREEDEPLPNVERGSSLGRPKKKSIVITLVAASLAVMVIAGVMLMRLGRSSRGPRFRGRLGCLRVGLCGRKTAVRHQHIRDRIRRPDLELVRRGDERVRRGGDAGHGIDAADDGTFRRGKERRGRSIHGARQASDQWHMADPRALQRARRPGAGGAGGERIVTATKPKRTRVRRRLLLASAVIAGSIVAVYVAAEIDMARERKARAYLRDQLYTEIRGSGAPVVFIAGLQGSTKYWGTAFDALASEHRLIFVDALGFGRSPWPREINYTLDDQVAWLRRTLVAKGATQNVTFVAHSFGTIIAAAYAARFPEDVSRVVLLGTPIFANEQQARERIRNMTKLGALFTFNKTLANLSCMTMCAFRPVLRRVLPRLRPDLDPAVVADSVLHDLPAVDGAVNRILLRENVQYPLQRVGPRAILIHGRNDTVTPIEDARRLALTTGAALIEMPGNHHQYFTEGVETIHRAIHAPPQKENS